MSADLSLNQLGLRSRKESVAFHHKKESTKAREAFFIEYVIIAGFVGDGRADRSSSGSPSAFGRI